MSSGIEYPRPLPLVVVSAVALVTGGPFTILKKAVASARASAKANFLFLVHDAHHWQESENVRFLGFPWARTSYLHRIIAEYLILPALSRRWRPDVWLSLADTTPPVTAARQVVYCHNPLPYWRPTLREFRLAPFEVFRSFVYGLAYRAFARRNDYLVGQLPWYTDFIGRYVGMPPSRWIVVAPGPNPDPSSGEPGRSVIDGPPHDRLECIYVSMPRVSKNFEEAIDLCDQPDMRLTLTLRGDENRYTRRVRRYATHRDVAFVGQLSHEHCLATMANADVVLFPSRLETFGLPVQEAIDLRRTVVLPVRPWTVAVAGGYEQAYFYRSVEEGRAILRALAKGDPPAAARPSPTSTDLPQLAGFEELYAFLLR